MVREKGADYLLYLLLDAIVYNYYHIIDTIGEKIDTYYFISYRLRDGKIVDIFP